MLFRFVPLRNYFSTDSIQHIGVSINDMQMPKKFYGEILGEVFIAWLTWIKGKEWTSILNADSRTAPRLGIGDVLGVCYYLFGSVAVELLRFCHALIGLTHDQCI